MGGWRPSRRRARRGGQDPHIAARLAVIGDRLGGHPRQEFRSLLRDRLLRAQADEPLGGPADRPSQTSPQPATGSRDGRRGPRHAARHASPASRAWRPLRAALRPASVIVMAVVMVIAGVGWATYRSMPGDVLYPLRRVSEIALLDLSVNDVTRAKRELLTARRRADEAAALATASGPDRDRLLRETLDNMDRRTRSAIKTLTKAKKRDKPGTATLKRFAKQQRNVVEPLLPDLNDASRRKANAYLHLIEGFEGGK
jgi:hypothetical protein